MPATQKLTEVDKLEELFSTSTGAIGLNYAGLTVFQAENLRKVVRESGARFRVVKNNLATIAADRVDNPALKDLLQGPTGLVLFSGDVVAPVKSVTEHIRTTRVEVPITGAVVDGQFMTGQDVQRVASLPSREVLQAQALGLLQAPMQNLLTVLNSHMRSLVFILQQRVQQLEETQGGEG